jgi:hypothetical protein
MNRVSMKITLLVSAFAMLSAACVEEADELTNGKGRRKGGVKAEGTACKSDDECMSGTCDAKTKVCAADEAGRISQALMCNVEVKGRSYAGFDGKQLGVGRVDEGSGVNRARVKPYAVMGTEFQRVLGNTPESLASAGGSFNAPPARWFAEPVYSGVSMNKAFDIAFEGCLTYAGGNAALKAAPNADSAKTECTSLMKKAWSRSPSPEELTACTDLAVTKLSTEPEPTRRWAYVCASILSSSQFLTY